MGLQTWLTRRRAAKKQAMLERYKPEVTALQQQECLSTARYNYERARKHRSEQDRAGFFLHRCLWFIVLAHLNGLLGMIHGYSLDLGIADLATKIERAKAPLVAQLWKILNAEDLRERALLICQFSYILMTVIDPTGCSIRDEIIYPALNADDVYSIGRMLDEGVRCDMDTFLPAMGFQPHHYKDGHGKPGISWYWNPSTPLQ